ALLSFLLGLSSVALCLLALTGVPALVVGLRGLRAVHLSDGRFRGARLALAGMLLGGLGTVATALGVAAIVVLRLQESSWRVGCAENLRQLGVSLKKYAEAHETFPPATRTPERLPPSRRISWMAD